MGANSFVCETIDGVAVLCWNDSTSMMNLLDFGVIMELRAHIDRIFRDDSVEGIVLTSGKKDFSGGMDLRLFSTFASNKEKESTENEGETELMLSNSQRAYTFIMQIHELLLLIEKSKKPFVSASPGTAIGGGYEIMLATHRRFLADNPKARIGLPEVLVGLFPGAGGTTRLIRMLGIARAAPYLLEGKLLNPEKAMRAGLVDEIVAPDKLVARAIAWVKQAKPADILKPWFKSDYKIPGGGVYSAAGASVFVSWIAMANQHSWGNYPNINGMLSAIYEGSLVSFETALRIETRWFVNVLLKPQSQAMIKTMFVNKQSLEKGGARPKEIPTNPVKKLGIVGAGFMGSEIAYSSACAGINVVLLDKDEESLNEDKKKIQTLVDEYAKRGISQDVIDGINSRLHFSMDTDEFKLCDLVIESVYEDLALKNEILNGIDAVVAPECIIATNTSTFLLNANASLTRIGTFLSCITKSNALAIVWQLVCSP
jgi:3-hydroxyacyl-CoA dehydrogenase/enoyl-CoA hydratase/3-hydroxybutyryl-CoA epimerase